MLARRRPMPMARRKGPNAGSIGCKRAAARGEHCNNHGKNNMAQVRRNCRVVLVTGGMGGLGETISTKMADAGYRVVGHLLARQHQARRVGREHEGERLRHHSPSPCDVADIDSCTRAVAEVHAKVGAVDILVNNAGITRDMTFKKMDKVNWDAVMRTNLDSLFNMTKQVVDGMVERGWGRVINVSSVNGSKGAFGQTNYSAAKAGVHGFTKALALEVGEEGRHRQHHLAGLHRHQDGHRDPRGHPRTRRSCRRSRSAGSASPRRSPG